MSTLFERIGEGQYAKLITAVGGAAPVVKPTPAPVKVQHLPHITDRRRVAAMMAHVATAPIPGTAAYAAERVRRG